MQKNENQEVNKIKLAFNSETTVKEFKQMLFHL